jgi:hypothetical protein
MPAAGGSMVVAPGNASEPQFNPQGKNRTFIIIIGIPNDVVVTFLEKL